MFCKSCGMTPRESIILILQFLKFVVYLNDGIWYTGRVE